MLLCFEWLRFVHGTNCFCSPSKVVFKHKGIKDLSAPGRHIAIVDSYLPTTSHNTFQLPCSQTFGRLQTKCRPYYGNPSGVLKPPDGRRASLLSIKYIAKPEVCHLILKYSKAYVNYEYIQKCQSFLKAPPSIWRLRDRLMDFLCENAPYFQPGRQNVTNASISLTRYYKNGLANSAFLA
jgi:hypothetical protein